MKQISTVDWLCIATWKDNPPNYNYIFHCCHDKGKRIDLKIATFSMLVLSKLRNRLNKACRQSLRRHWEPKCFIQNNDNGHGSEGLRWSLHHSLRDGKTFSNTLTCLLHPKNEYISWSFLFTSSSLPNDTFYSLSLHQEQIWNTQQILRRIHRNFGTVNILDDQDKWKSKHEMGGASTRVWRVMSQDQK
jgi:hypothetical protein